MRDIFGKMEENYLPDKYWGIKDITENENLDDEEKKNLPPTRNYRESMFDFRSLISDNLYKYSDYYIEFQRLINEYV